MGTQQNQTLFRGRADLRSLFLLLLPGLWPWDLSGNPILPLSPAPPPDIHHLPWITVRLVLQERPQTSSLRLPGAQMKWSVT